MWTLPEAQEPAVSEPVADRPPRAGTEALADTALPATETPEAAALMLPAPSSATGHAGHAAGRTGHRWPHRSPHWRPGRRSDRSPSRAGREAAVAGRVAEAAAPGAADGHRAAGREPGWRVGHPELSAGPGTAGGGRQLRRSVRHGRTSGKNARCKDGRRGSAPKENTPIEHDNSISTEGVRALELTVCDEPSRTLAHDK